MSDKLQKAIKATRAGDTKNAQFLLTQAIQEDPNNPHSWYLLSLIVEDKDKKTAYLTKVIELDPDHAKAHEQLIAITETAVSPSEPIVEETVSEAVAVSLSSDSSDYEVQDSGETLPDWMADDLPPIEDNAEDFVVETEVVTEEEPVPDWLDGALDEDWDQKEDETVASETSLEEPHSKESAQPAEEVEEEKKEVPPKEKKPAKAKEGLSEKQLNYLLIGLVIIAILIFMIMAYMIFTMM